MQNSKIFSALGQVVNNTKRLIALVLTIDRKLTILYYATAAFGAVIPVAAGVLSKYLIDNLQISQQQGIGVLPVILIGLLATTYILDILEEVILWGYHYSYLDYIFRNKLQNEINYLYYTKVSHLDIAHFEDPKTQDLITKTRDTMTWRVPDFLRMFSYFLSEIVGYLSAFVILIPFGMWVPFLITCIAIPRIYLRAKHGFVQWSIYGSGAPQAKKLWYFGHLLQNKNAISEMRIFQSTNAMLKKYKQIQNNLFEINKVAVDRYLKVRNIPSVIEIIILLFIGLLFLPKTIAGSVTIGSYILLLSMMGRLNSKASGAAQRVGELYEHSLYVDNFFEILDFPIIIQEDQHPVVLDSTTPPKIEFKGVTFAYPKGKAVLKDVTFVINPGESVAFVGDNGAGKTTIIKLLCRFYDIQKGEILINGTNIKNVSLESLYKLLGTLFQYFTQYHFSIKENITLGNPNKNDEDAIIDAAKKSDSYEFIKKLPNQFDTMLGKEFEDGEELSGGQWQKLAIARAFYEEPPVLILDEPTSAIDAQAEYEIFNNLQKQYTKKTLILISHRFSTVRNANKIFVIHKGRITESGTHEELLHKKNKYHRLFTIQAAGYK